MRGYYKDPEATAAIRSDGWQYTGDIGVFDEHGYLAIVDRKHDMIISGGFNVYPSEIEADYLGLTQRLKIVRSLVCPMRNGVSRLPQLLS